MALAEHCGQRVDLGCAPCPLESTPLPSAPPEDECILVQRVAAHDSQAFETLYTQYAPPLRRYLARRLRPLGLVDEVLNDTMMVLWQHATRFNAARAPLAAWLYGIARLKSRKAWFHAAGPPSAPNSDDALDPDTPEAVLLRREQGNQLASCLAILPPAERTAVRLMVFEGCSCQDIATQVNVPLSTITTRLWRARRRLASWLTADGQRLP